MTVDLRIGHVLDVLRAMPPASVHMVWSSPPYWGLRAYGTEPQVWGGEPGCSHRFEVEVPGDSRRGQIGTTSVMASRAVADIQVAGRQAGGGAFCPYCGAWRGEHGLEPTLALWLEHEVLIWREVARVLRPDGTAWVNIGDAYASRPNGRRVAESQDDRTFRDRPVSTLGGGLKPKDRLMMPARLAIALCDDGWWLRDEIVWAKANPMPSSVGDRTTPAHEMLYLLARRRHYYFDAVAIMEPCARPDWEDGTRVFGGANKAGANAAHGERTTGRRAGAHPRRNDGQRDRTQAGGDGFDNRVGTWVDSYMPAMRAKRSVWSLTSEPFPEAHFATAPTALVSPCVLAGTSAKGCCPACGAPWARITERRTVNRSGSGVSGNAIAGKGHVSSQVRAGHDVRNGPTSEVVTKGWRPTCKCPAHEPIPCTVLDPFGGAGTTGLVADSLGRDAVLIELNPEYARIARDRIRRGWGQVTSGLPEPDGADLPLLAREAS